MTGAKATWWVVGLVVAGLLPVVDLSEAGAQQPTPQQWQQQLNRLRQQGRQPNIEWENVDFTGTLKGMQGSLLQVAVSDTETWLLQVEARPQDILYQGTAEAAFVVPGMLVEFNAKVNKRGQAAEPVTSLTIFTVREGRGVGLMPEGGARGEAELFSESKEEKKAPPRKGPQEDPTYQIGGQITKISRGELSVNCAGTVIRADLDKQAKVAIDVNHLNYAQVGDKVEIYARFPKGQRAANQGLATRVTVIGAKPLGETKKRVLPGKGPAEAKGEEPAAEEPKKEEPKKEEDKKAE
jgi:hypothetical protein